MSISSIAAGIGGFQRSTSGIGGIGGQQANVGGAPTAPPEVASPSQGASDSSGISDEAAKMSGSQAGGGVGGAGQAQQVTQALQQGLEAIGQAKQSGGDASSAVAALKETYQQVETSGGLEQVDTEVRGQTEEVLGIKNGVGGAEAAASAQEAAPVADAGEAQQQDPSGGNAAGGGYSSGVKSGLDSLLGG